MDSIENEDRSRKQTRSKAKHSKIQKGSILGRKRSSQNSKTTGPRWKQREHAATVAGYMNPTIAGRKTCCTYRKLNRYVCACRSEKRRGKKSVRDLDEEFPFSDDFSEEFSVTSQLSRCDWTLRTVCASCRTLVPSVT